MSPQPKTPGLAIEWSKQGGMLWAKIIHAPSGKTAHNMTNKLIEGGMRRFVQRVDAACAGFDWTISEEAMMAEPDKGRARREALYSITYTP